MAMAKICFPIFIDIIDRSGWPDRAVAEAWLAAAGGDMRTFNSWLEQVTVIGGRGLDEDRIRRIARLVARIAF